MNNFWYGIIAGIPLFMFIGMLIGNYLRIPTMKEKAWILFSDVNGVGTCQRCPKCGNKYRLNNDLGFSSVYKTECSCGFTSESIIWEK